MRSVEGKKRESEFLCNLYSKRKVLLANSSVAVSRCCKEQSSITSHLVLRSSVGSPGEVSLQANIQVGAVCKLGTATGMEGDMVDAMASRGCDRYLMGSDSIREAPRW